MERGSVERLGSQDLGVSVVERRLERGRGHVTVEHPRILVVEDRRFHSAAEQRLRLSHEVLVERVLARDEHGQPVSAPAGAAPLLAHAGDGPRKADRDHGVEHPDVDPELERVRRAHTEQLAGEEALLDLASLRGCVPGAVRREPGGIAEAVGRELVDQLGGAAALREHERAQAALDEISHQLRRLGERARPLAQLLVDQRRVPERDRPLRFRRSVRSDDREVEARQRGGEFAGVRDRRGGEQELRVRSVHVREPAQAAEDVRRRASRRRRGRRAPRRRRHSGGWRARPPSGRGAAGRPRGACPGWSG